MTANPIFRVLEEGTKRDDVARVLGRLGFQLRNTWRGDDRSAYEEVWATPDETNAVNYAEDPVTLAHYVSIRGSHPEIVLRKIAALLQTIAPEEAVDSLMRAATHDEQVRGLFRLAITFPELEPDVKEIFEQFATNAPDPRLRDAAVNAIGYRGWPELIPLLERVAVQDASQDVRDSAARISRSLRSSTKDT